MADSDPIRCVFRDKVAMYITQVMGKRVPNWRGLNNVYRKKETTSGYRLSASRSSVCKVQGHAIGDGLKMLKFAANQF